MGVNKLPRVVTQPRPARGLKSRPLHRKCDFHHCATTPPLVTVMVATAGTATPWRHWLRPAGTTTGRVHCRNGCRLHAANALFRGRSRAPIYNSWFHGPPRIHTPNSVLIGSFVFAGLTVVTNIQTDRPRHAVYRNISHFASNAAMRADNMCQCLNYTCFCSSFQHFMQ